MWLIILALILIILVVWVGVFAIPNLLFMALWGIVIIAAIASAVGSVALAVLIVIKLIKRAPKEELKKYLLYLAASVVLYFVLRYVNNELMPIAHYWLVEVTNGVFS